jgi:hypothetical protein
VRQEATALATIPPADSIEVPDGTPLELILETDLSSADAKVGEIVKFMTPAKVRINGLAILPKATVVYGSVVMVRRPRRASRDGGVSVEFKSMTFPNGQVATLRPERSRSEKPSSRTVQFGLASGTSTGPSPEVMAYLPFLPIYGVAVLAAKGHDQVIPAKTSITLYFNGPLYLDRATLKTYVGPAQVFFRNNVDANNSKLYCGQQLVGDFSVFVPLRLELTAGTYSFSTGEIGEQAVQIEVQKDQQYWIEEDDSGLLVKDPQQYQDEMERFEGLEGVTDKNLTGLLAGNFCAPTSRP